jgi:hypothetical protein
VFRKKHAPDLIRGGNRFSDENTRKTKEGVRPIAGGLAGALLVLGLTSCNVDDGAGYVEIKAVPASATVPLYLDAVKLEPLRNGNAVLRQKVGMRKLQTDIDGGQMSFLCNIEVKKNRITSVTVSVMSRQPRCQCGRTSGSDAATTRTCIG